MVFSKIPKRFLLSGFYTTFFVSIGLIPLHAQQSGEKLIKFLDVEQITDAVLVSNVSVAGKVVDCGLFVKPPAVVQPVASFQAGGDWLQDTTISLVNRTKKTIVYGGIILRFMDVGECSVAQPCVEAEIHLGQMPSASAYDGRTGRPLRLEHPDRGPLNWRPKQTMIVHVSDYISEISSNLAPYMAVTNVKKVSFSRGVFYFDDGMSWRLGRYTVPDPQHAGKVNELPIDYFPGIWGNNWPPGYNNR